MCSSPTLTPARKSSLNYKQTNNDVAHFMYMANASSKRSSLSALIASWTNPIALDIYSSAICLPPSWLPPFPRERNKRIRGQIERKQGKKESKKTPATFFYKNQKKKLCRKNNLLCFSPRANRQLLLSFPKPKNEHNTATAQQSGKFVGASTVAVRGYRNSLNFGCSKKGALPFLSSCLGRSTAGTVLFFFLEKR
jgi:hypothetical protein